MTSRDDKEKKILKICQFSELDLTKCYFIWLVGFPIQFNSHAIPGKGGAALKVKGGKRDPTDKCTQTFPQVPKQTKHEEK